jgi:hypothetical protein
MARDVEAQERRWERREGNFAGMFAGMFAALLFMFLMTVAVLGIFLIAE